MKTDSFKNPVVGMSCVVLLTVLGMLLFKLFLPFFIDLCIPSYWDIYNEPALRFDGNLYLLQESTENSRTYISNRDRIIVSFSGTDAMISLDFFPYPMMSYRISENGEERTVCSEEGELLLDGIWQEGCLLDRQTGEKQKSFGMQSRRTDANPAVALILYEAQKTEIRGHGDPFFTGLVAFLASAGALVGVYWGRDSAFWRGNPTLRKLLAISLFILPFAVFAAGLAAHVS